MQCLGELIFAALVYAVTSSGFLVNVSVIRYEMLYFNVRSKADMSQLFLPHGYIRNFFHQENGSRIVKKRLRNTAKLTIFVTYLDFVGSVC